MKRTVIVDDDERTRRVLQILVERIGLESEAFSDASQALEFLERESVDLILTDLKMPTMSGIEFMRALRELDANVPVIVLTAYGTVEAAVEAMKLGALDFVAKPFDVDALELLVRRSIESSRHQAESRYLREQVADRAPELEQMVGVSPEMEEVFDVIQKVAPTTSSVLVTGETGTGKELAAHAIHNLSPRREALFVPINCTAIPGELLEAELFGHVRGAFSGAHADRVGRFQAADGGTVFLDEVGDMQPTLQAKLLRVLQEGVVERVGSNRRTRVDVRVVSSTNRDLEQAMADGRFREDLYFRLNVFRIELPPLRERREDIPILAGAFLQEFCRKMGREPLSIDPSALDCLAAYHWPGNVRELRNLMERAVVFAGNSDLHAELLASLLPEESAGPAAVLPLADAVASAERRAIQRALVASDDNKAGAAKLLGIGERTLWSKLKKHDI